MAPRFSTPAKPTPPLGRSHTRPNLVSPADESHGSSAHDEAALAALKAAAAQRLAAGQAELDLGVAGRPGSEPLPITSTRAAHLWDALCRTYDVLGFDSATGGDEVFRQLVWRGSSNRPDSKIRCACSTRQVWPARRIRH